MIGGGPAAAKAMMLYAGANQYTGQAYSAKVSHRVVNNITNVVNKTDGLDH